MTLSNFNLDPLTKYPSNVLTDTQFCSKEDLGFFIALGAVYNDMKDIFWIYQQLEENPVDPKDMSPYRGQHSGMQVFVLRNMVSIFHEFVILLSKNQSCLESEAFKYAESKLGFETKRDWAVLRLLAHDREDQLSSKNRVIVKALTMIRNSVCSHYYSIKNFSNGFDMYAQSNSPEVGVYSSLGDSMQATRFFFSDASVQFAMDKVLRDKNLSHDDLLGFVQKINRSLRFLIESFLYCQDKILNSNRQERREEIIARNFKVP